MDKVTHPVTSEDLRRAARDFGVWAFLLVAVAALVVSMPATYDIARRFHYGDQLGQIQTAGTLVVFELGALLAKLSTLFVPQWSRRLNLLQVFLLAIVGVANYQAAALVATQQSVIEIMLFAGTIPLLQWVFQGLIVGRIHGITLARGGGESTRALTPDELAFIRFQEMRNAFFVDVMDDATRRIQGALTTSASYPRLAAQQDYPAPAPVIEDASQVSRETCEAPSYICPNCGAELTLGQYGSAVRRGYCRSCKEAVSNRDNC